MYCDLHWHVSVLTVLYVAILYFICFDMPEAVIRREFNKCEMVDTTVDVVDLRSIQWSIRSIWSIGRHGRYS